MSEPAPSPGVSVCRQAWVALALLLVAVTLLSCASHPLRGDRPRGVYHRVKAGETLFAIARAYQVELQELAEINNISNPAQIEADRVIFVPDANQIVDDVPLLEPPAEATSPEPAAVAPKPRTPTPAPADRKGRPPGERVAVRGGPPPEPVPAPAPGRKPPGEAQRAAPGKAAPKPGVVPAPPPPARRDDGEKGLTFEKQRFIWPVKGKVVSQFGMQPNRMYFNGIRIAAPGGSAVLAAAAGTVIFSAPLRDYGETIIIKHADQYATVYTHLGTRTVTGEARVQRGDRIAFVADPGQGEPFVDFEIRHRNKARNPLFFLP